MDSDDAVTVADQNSTAPEPEPRPAGNTNKRDEHWTAVDRYLEEHLVPRDEVLDEALEANLAAGLPAIDVSPTQGKLLHVLALTKAARRILEVGTLGGYSTIWLARALPADGRLVTLELEPKHADVARANLERAGMAAKVEILVGPAIESLTAMVERGEAAFDLIFIDADKERMPQYLELALQLAAPGTLIVADNVVREGRVLDSESVDPDVQGVRGMFALMGAEPRLAATAIQTVGSKGWDGFAIAVVVG